MNSRITKTVALAALLSGTAGIASANEGWYGRADVGYSTDASVDTDFGTGDLDNNWMESLGLGYALSNGFRLEGELAHRYNDADDDAFFDKASIHAWSAMLNGYYDFNRGGNIQPYVGVGVGGARLNGKLVAPAGAVDDSDTVFAWQAMAGVAIGLSEQTSLDIGYRYFRADNANFSGTGAFAPSQDADYQHQAVTIGLRHTFAAPPPPPPPPAPPPPPPPPPPPVAAACPQSDFVVYFEWDRSNLNQAAMETIDAAVNRARECNVTGAVVVGHTDTSGSAAYNVGLSERRASVVRDALVSRGMSADAIQTQAHGETDLARPTRDGVKEPLNRRTAVTITFH